MKPKQYFRPDEISWKLGVSKRTVYRLIQDGELLAFSVRDRGAVRIPAESFEKYQKRRLEKYQIDNGIIMSGCDSE